MAKNSVYRANNVKFTRSKYFSGPQYDTAPNMCSYCGLQGSITEEHVFPVSGMAQLIAAEPNLDIKSWIIPCCHECNSALSARNPYILGGNNTPRSQFLRKRGWVREWIKKRYATARNWSEEDLTNLYVGHNKKEDQEKISYRLAQYVDNSYSKEDIEMRLRYDCFNAWY